MYPSQMHPRSLPKLVDIGEGRNRHIDRPVKINLHSAFSLPQLTDTASTLLHTLHQSISNLLPLLMKIPRYLNFPLEATTLSQSKTVTLFQQRLTAKSKEKILQPPNLTFSTPRLCVPRNSKHNLWQSAVLVKSSHHILPLWFYRY